MHEVPAILAGVVAPSLEQSWPATEEVRGVRGAWEEIGMRGTRGSWDRRIGQKKIIEMFETNYGNPFIFIIRYR